MAIMFSSPEMIGMLILGIFVILAFVGAIIVAIVQVLRGRFGVDYDKLAVEAMEEYRKDKKRRN